MSARPWMKFYPRDWRGDQALRAVSMAARGFWLECLCIMHEANPYGYLLLNGEQLEGGALARMTGASADEVSAWTAELRKAGVLSVSRNGAVFSRRMVKDEAASKKGRKEAEKRWSQPVAKQQKSDEPIGVPNGKPNAQRPEAREFSLVMEGEQPKPIADQFAEFRKAYPKRDGQDPKEPARKKFEAAVKSGVDPELIIAGAKAFAAAEARRGKVGTPFIPHSAVWLNQRRWEDAAEPGLAPPPPPTDVDQQWRKRLSRWRETGDWNGHWGNHPETPGFQALCPKHILREFNLERPAA